MFMGKETRHHIPGGHREFWLPCPPRYSLKATQRNDKVARQEHDVAIELDSRFPEA